jgi:hypothetical protein
MKKVMMVLFLTMFLAGNVMAANQEIESRFVTGGGNNGGWTNRG